MAYRTIDPRMWDDDKFLDLSMDARFVWIYLLTGPHTTPLPGLFVAGIGSISDGLRMPPETVSRGLAELSSKGLAMVDSTHRVIRVPNAPRYNPPANGNVLTGWFNLWSGLPECALKRQHAAGIREEFQGVAWFEATWVKTFGAVPEPSPKPFAEPLPNGMPTHDHDHGHDHGHDKELSSGRPDTSALPGQLALGTTAQIAKPADAEQMAITAVLVKWRDVAGMPKATIDGPAAKKRRDRVLARMKEGWTLARLTVVLEGMTRDPFLMGTDPKSKPGGFKDVETVFRDNAQCERLEILGTGEPVVRHAGKPAFAHINTDYFAELARQDEEKAAKAQRSAT